MNEFVSYDFNLDVLDPMGNRGYLPQEIPSARDGQIGKLLTQTLDEQNVAKFARLLKEGRAVVLRVFSERMASLAVRNRDSTSLRLGLIALLLTWQGPDSRETLTVFPLYCDATRRLGIDPAQFVASIQQTIGDQLVRPFVDFLKRSEDNKSLKVMGYAEGTDKEGFRYVRNW